MKNSQIHSRTLSLISKYISFIQSIKTDHIKENITLEHLIKLKSVLSDINNIMTLVTTYTIASLLVEGLRMNDEARKKLFQTIDRQKPNTNGFDIQIDSPYNILVEVKCNSLVHNKKLGSAQINAILDDARKLRFESQRTKKVRRKIKDTKDYIKIIAIANLSSKSDVELLSMIITPTKCRESTDPIRKERMEVQKFLRPLNNLVLSEKEIDKEYVYIMILSQPAIKKELENIINNLPYKL